MEDRDPASGEENFAYIKEVDIENDAAAEKRARAFTQFKPGFLLL